MTVRAIAIPSDVRERIYAHALATFPEECCGYLTGPRDGDGVEIAIACRNAQADGGHPLTPTRGADTGFVISGSELLQFARGFDGDQPPRVVYHSHTNGRAYFSDVDRAMAEGAAYPVQHLVVGVRAGAITEAAQFGWSDAAHDHLELARWSR